MLFKTNVMLSTTTGITDTIYKKSDNQITKFGEQIVGLLGSIGGICFTIAVMVIAIVIIFGSVSPKNIGRWWIALFSCFCGAALFFGAYLFPDIVAGIFSGNKKG